MKNYTFRNKIKGEVHGLITYTDIEAMIILPKKWVLVDYSHDRIFEIPKRDYKFVK